MQVDVFDIGGVEHYSYTYGVCPSGGSITTPFGTALILDDYDGTLIPEEAMEETEKQKGLPDELVNDANWEAQANSKRDDIFRRMFE